MKARRLVDFIIVGILVLGSILWWKMGPTPGNNSGLNQNGKVGLETDEKHLPERQEEGETQGEQKEDLSTKTEKLAKKLRENRNIVEGRDYSKEDNQLYSWWFKRNDNHEPSGCQEDYNIGEYGGYYVAPTKKMYLTFDCGYENGFTSDILDVLKEEKVPAAFFVTQTFIRDNVELVKRMKEEGHLVCNHSVHHPSMPEKSVDEQKKEILDCENYMKEATGYDMDLFFRPPKGEYSKRTLLIAKDLGYYSVFWSVAYLDYDVNNQPSKEHVVEHFKKYCHPGAIPLLHNVSKANHDALQEVISNLKNDGYEFGTLYDLVTS